MWRGGEPRQDPRPGTEGFHSTLPVTVCKAPPAPALLNTSSTLCPRCPQRSGNVTNKGLVLLLWTLRNQA